jgi:tRNA 2-thiouridine synthesizing protein A
MTSTKLDLKGLKCPLPALKTRKALKDLVAGDELIVECTDPLAAIDIPNLMRQTGDALLDTNKQEDVIVFRIRKN